MTNRPQLPTNENATVITSASNPQIKALRSLERKKGRREHDAFLAEGTRLISEALSYDWQPISIIFGPEALKRSVSKSVIEQAESAGARRLAVNDRLLGQIARKENPQTLLATFRPRYTPLDELQRSSDSRGSWLALYQVRDPGNLGTILRTADFAGVKGVILIGDCCDLYSLECVRSTMGSLFAMPVYNTGPEDFLAWKLETGLPMIAASMNGDTPHHEAPYEAECIILMGNEQSGLPEDFEAACDVLSRIPMRDGADSLNLATATALMIYAAWGTRGYAL